MRLFLGLAALGAFIVGLQPTEPTWTVVVGGDSDGHLAPCGCTDPMSGGIRRRVTATLSQGDARNRLILETGFFAAGTGTQDRYKAEALAETVGALHAVTALTPPEARFGPAEVGALRSLSNDAFVSGDAAGIEGVPTLARRGPFAVTTISPDPSFVAGPLGKDPIDSDAAMKAVMAENAPVLMFGGDEEQARELARRYPKIALIAHRRGGAPSEKLETEGNTALVSPGDQGKHIVALDWSGGRWSNYRVIDLGPEIKDDRLVAKIYAAYLQRVDGAGLLDRLARAPSAGFVNNEVCLKCHAEAAHVWEGSAHSHAYATLERQGHARDPDCVRCHVVGLEAEGGFRSRQTTPAFAFVGCQSCHGPGADHARDPKIAIARSGPEDCLRCHTRDNSPKFDFLTYWAKVAHGRKTDDTQKSVRR